MKNKTKRNKLIYKIHRTKQNETKPKTHILSRVKDRGRVAVLYKYFNNETKRDETKRLWNTQQQMETKRNHVPYENETKRDEIRLTKTKRKQNKSKRKRNECKRNETKQNETRVYGLGFRVFELCLSRVLLGV